MKILLISRDADASLNMKAMLKRVGFKNIAVTQSAIEVLPFCAKTPPDLILCDEQVQFSSSWRLITEIKLAEEISNFPVIYLYQIQSTFNDGNADLMELKYHDFTLSKDKTKRADRGTARCEQRSACIEANGEVTGDQWIIRESRVETRVTNFKNIIRVDGMATEGDVASCFSGIQSYPRLEPLTILINQRNKSYRRPANLRSELNNVLIR